MVRCDGHPTKKVHFVYVNLLNWGLNTAAIAHVSIWTVVDSHLGLYSRDIAAGRKQELVVKNLSLSDLLVSDVQKLCPLLLKSKVQLKHPAMPNARQKSPWCME